MQQDPMQTDSASHRRVLDSLRKLILPEYGILVEEVNNRLDLPNESFRENRKGVEQRKRSLSYVDAVVHVARRLRVLIEVVDKSPSGPNGITGLTVNADRIAEIQENIDLVFIVLAEMKNFYCGTCGRGHQIKNKRKRPCFTQLLEDHSGREPDYMQLIHEGKAAAFRKVLVDYPINKYLHNIRPPSVIFLNATKVRTAWDTYETHALQLIEEELQEVISLKDRTQSQFRGLRELLPELGCTDDEEVRGRFAPTTPGAKAV